VAANRYLEPSTAGVRHICADYTARDFSVMGIIPGYAPRTDIGPELDEALSCKLIEVELQSILQASSVSRTRHRRLPFLVLGDEVVGDPSVRSEPCAARDTFSCSALLFRFWVVKTKVFP
jgi:hypothetical protein